MKTCLSTERNNQEEGENIMMQKEDCGGGCRNDVLEKWKGKWDPSTSGRVGFG